MIVGEGGEAGAGQAQRRHRAAAAAHHRGRGGGRLGAVVDDAVAAQVAQGANLVPEDPGTNSSETSTWIRTF
jgi:hypothetical protein